MATGTMREAGAGALRRLLAPLIRRRRFKRDLAALTAKDAHDDARRALYRQLVPAGGLVFDIGANVGNRVKIFAGIANKVVAFEPQPYCIEVLRRGFGARPDVVIVPKAVGRSAGRSSMRVSESHTLSSMSAGWIEAVQSSGRFASHDWSNEIEIEVTTLDEAIAAYGRPDFVKIDVEGFEAEVLAGLHTPVPAISFEFTPEFAGSTRRCVEHLMSIAGHDFNISFGESMQLELQDWCGADRILEIVEGLGAEAFGDVYARLVGGATPGRRL